MKLIYENLSLAVENECDSLPYINFYGIFLLINLAGGFSFSSNVITFSRKHLINKQTYHETTSKPAKPRKFYF